MSSVGNNGSGVGNGYWGSGGCNNTVVGSVRVRVGKSSVAVVGILSRAGSNSTGKNNLKLCGDKNFEAFCLETNAFMFTIGMQ